MRVFPQLPLTFDLLRLKSFCTGSDSRCRVTSKKRFQVLKCANWPPYKPKDMQTLHRSSS